ncbi:MAG TPA: polysaccharide biosynthesis/export family protein [Verrucomicrobiae bacterium]|jgi:polysaccharide export outer membrane protein
MEWNKVVGLALTAWLAGSSFLYAQQNTAASGSLTQPPATATQSYILSPNDVVQVHVYQEDDLETKMRIGKDGTSSFPLIGGVRIGGKTVEQAAQLIRDRLAKDYLVNPQVTLTVVEYAKRRFTVLGQVQRPGTYEIPNEESVTFLQAIAMAGGYTRLASKSNVIVTRMVAGQKQSFTLDVNSAASAVSTKPFEILPDDTISVPERLF